MRKTILSLVTAISVFCLASVALYFLPPVHDRLAWRVEDVRMRVKAVVAPPEQAEFLPEPELVVVSQVTSPPPTRAASPTASPTAAPTQVENTPLPSPAPTETPEPLPPRMNLTGIRYQDQHGLWNYCAPANLAMALSFWGWEGDRLDTGEVLKPYDRDKNVMPYEMADYVAEHTDLSVVSRVGGEFDLLKRLLNGGFPVIIEKGAYIRDSSGVVSWMGHYEVATGYDDEKGVFITQDSYFTPDYEVPYEEFLQGWRSFNYTYLVVYPPEKESEVMAILGPHADATYNFQYAAQKASDEIFALTGVDQLFAWYNRGTNLKELQDFGGAAQAYDEAFAIYNTLPEDKSVRPYRILWYQTGPYYAYYYTGRHQAVISLATTSIDAALDEPALEESYYWRAMSRAALGDTGGAVEDFRKSLDPYHPGFEPSLYQLQLLGVEP